MNNIFALKGKIQNYAWGGTQFIPNLLDTTPNQEKCAEYWLGAHVNAPGVVITDQGEKNLDSLLGEDLVANLGDRIATQFGRLPFLFKVLDVADMLSIQVHPTKVEAEKGFAKENELGIALNAPHRNYKDDNHKPEIMVALSEFWLLHGFLPIDELNKVLTEVPEFTSLIPVFENEGYYGLYKHVMEQSEQESDTMLQPLVDRIMSDYKEGKLEKSSPHYWAAKAVDSSVGTSLDKGIYSIYFFNIVKAESGEAVFQDAGIPHAYLEGQNMELMANSDNVLRGGLTPKHVDVPELLKHVIFEETIPNVMSGVLQPDGIERIYKSPAPDFELSRIDLKEGQIYTGKANTAQVFMTIDGEAELLEGDASVKLGKGSAALVLADGSYQIKTTSNVTLYKATAP